MAEDLPVFAAGRVWELFEDSDLDFSDVVPEYCPPPFITLALATALGAEDAFQLFFTKDVEEVDRVLAGEIVYD